MVEIVLFLFGGVVTIGFVCACFAYAQNGGSIKTTTIHKVETTCISCRRLRTFTRKGPYR